MTTASSDLNMNGFSIINVKSITGINGLWKIDENGNITAQSVQTQALTVGGGVASGVTIYDRETTAPKCIYIEGGVIKTSDGACGQTTNAGTTATISETIPSPVATSSVSEINTATTTPAVEPVLTATSTLEVSPAASEPVVATSTETVIISETATTTP